MATINDAFRVKNNLIILGTGTSTIGGALQIGGALTGVTTQSMTGQLTNTLAIGTAPFVITSTTRVANLNVASAGLADTVTTNANLTGPITSSGNATSVTANAITNAMLAQVATASFLGRVTAATGNVETLTATQARSILNVADGATANVGTVTSVGGTGTVNGLTLTGSVTASGNLTLGGTLSGIANGALANSTVTIGSTSVALGATVTTFAGLTSVTSTTFVGALTGNASSATTASTVTTNANLTGPITSSGNATSVTANAITNAMLAQIPTANFHGRVTAATGNVENLTGTQATTLLDVFTTSLKGLAPASGGGTTNFLRADGTWTTPGGGGTVTSVSVTTANGVSGSVATATSTPAITITLGAITPTTVAPTATGSAWSATNQAKATFGVIHLATGSGNDIGNAITFGGFGDSQAQAGIYTIGNSANGTTMYLSTTNSYSTGPQTAISISPTGAVSIVRSTLNVTGAVTGASFSGVGTSLTALTAGNLSGTIPTGVLGNSSLFIGTTSIALNRATASQALTGITSIDGSAATWTTGRTFALSGDVTGTSAAMTGAGNLSWAVTISAATVTGKVLTGYTSGANTALAATDTILAAMGKIQGQITARSGTVTSVGGTGTVSGLTLTGTVTTTGNLTLGGTLAVTAANFASQTANTFLSAPNGSAGVPTFRTIAVADIPTLNQNTTGSSASCTGNAATATNLSTNRTNWSTNGTISAVVGQLAWKNYGNTHTIFDASAGTAPDGSAVNATNAAYDWVSSYGNLMGWNGAATYGVRVDSCRLADGAPWSGITSKPTTLSGYGITNGLSTDVSQSLAAGISHSTTVNSNNAIASLSNANTAWVSLGNGTGPAVMTFHRPSAFAAFLGIDTDNKWKVGGWSMGTASYELLNSKNNTSLQDDTRNTRGVTRLYRSNDDSDFSVQTTWDGARWFLQGYNGDTYHAEARVAYADRASLVNDGYTNVSIGYRDIPLTVQNATYSFALADAGRGFGKDNATAYTYTIPANASVAFPVGTAITVFNNNTTSNITIAITTDTLRLGGTTTTGSRTLAPFGVCTLLKVASTTWIASGAGLT